MSESKDSMNDELLTLVHSVISKRKTYPSRILELEKRRTAILLERLVEAKVELDDDFSQREILIACEKSEALLDQLPKNREPSTIIERLKRNKRRHQNIQRYLDIKENNYNLELF